MSKHLSSTFAAAWSEAAYEAALSALHTAPLDGPERQAAQDRVLLCAIRMRDAAEALLVAYTPPLPPLEPRPILTLAELRRIGDIARARGCIDRSGGGRS